MDTVSRNGYDEYRKRLELAQREFDEVFELDSEPPLVAFDKRIQVGLEMGSELSEVDSFCQRAMALYPGEEAPHEAIAFKLLPQWFGEPGDFVSFALSVSKMMEGPDSDVLYLRLMSGAVDYVPRSGAEWSSYDRNKLLRGVEEANRRKINLRYDMWKAWSYFNETRDMEAADRIVQIMMDVNAVAPDYTGRDANAIHRSAERIRGR
jgi:hypothetical protein